MSGQSAIGRIIDHVETELSSFYGFSPLVRASHHVVADDWMKAAIGGELLRLDHPAARGAVYVTTDSGSDELYIGIHLADVVCDRLVNQNPILNLTDTNLDEFCVLVEEVSHFHLIANRVMMGRPVSRLELEFQAEIDKVIMSAIFLKNQVGDSHLLPLVRKLFDHSRIIAEDHELYWQATKHAARFWYQQIHRTQHLTEGLRVLLRRRYDELIHEKLLNTA